MGRGGRVGTRSWSGLHAPHRPLRLLARALARRGGVGWLAPAEPQDTAPAHLARGPLSPGSQETEIFTCPAVHGHRWLHSSQSAAGLRIRLCRLQQLPSPLPATSAQDAFLFGSKTHTPPWLPGLPLPAHVPGRARNTACSGALPGGAVNRRRDPRGMWRGRKVSNFLKKSQEASAGKA